MLPACTSFQDQRSIAFVLHPWSVCICVSVCEFLFSSVEFTFSLRWGKEKLRFGNFTAKISNPLNEYIKLHTNSWFSNFTLFSITNGQSNEIFYKKNCQISGSAVKEVWSTEDFKRQHCTRWWKRRFVLADLHSFYADHATDNWQTADLILASNLLTRVSKIYWRRQIYYSPTTVSGNQKLSWTTSKK